MVELGSALTEADYDLLIDGPHARHGVRVFHLAPADVDAARQVLLAEVDPGRARLFTRLPLIVSALGVMCAHILGWPEPTAALVHREVPLHAHRDTQAPYRCRNITLLLAQGCEGGHLVLPDERVAVACQDGTVVGFDGEQMHGITDFALAPGGHRVAVSYYSPRTED